MNYQMSSSIILKISADEQIGLRSYSNMSIIGITFYIFVQLGVLNIMPTDGLELLVVMTTGKIVGEFLPAHAQDQMLRKT